MSENMNMVEVQEVISETMNSGIRANATGTQAGKPTPSDLGWDLYDVRANEDPTGFECNAAVYEWDGEEGDVGPEFPALELQLFGTPESRLEIKGIDYSMIEEIDVHQEGPARIQPIHSFDDAGLHPVMHRNVELAGYKAPTPIQKYTLPAVHLGYDVIGIAQTGSGKTAAYMIPILNKLMGKAKKLAAPRPNPAEFVEGVSRPVRAEPLVVVVCPTRELAIQIFNEARKFCYRTMLRPCVVYGGTPMRDQVAQLSRGCDILVATPGRLIDFLHRAELLTFRRLKYMVIDEADEMLHSDWSEEFEQILVGGEQDVGNVKYMLFSATFPKAARDLAQDHLAAEHVRIRVGRAGSTVRYIKQNIMEIVPPRTKKEALLEVLQSMPPTRTIIFVNSRRAADEVDDYLFNMGLPCTSITGDRTQLEREASMRAFRSGKAPILIATAVSARGIDVRKVQHVINYDIPSLDHGGIEEYTHRIGRTGRMGHRGLSTSFFTEADEPMGNVLVRTLLETNQAIPDFLERFKPEGIEANQVKFETESDWDEHEAAMTGNAGGDGAGEDPWGIAEDNADNAAANDGNDAWGSVAQAATKDNAWGSNARQPEPEPEW